MSEKSKEIEKPWCIYENILGNPQGFGKVEKDSKTSVTIKYSEKQLYFPEAWDSKFVKRFKTLEDAVKYYIKNKAQVDIRYHEMTSEEIWNIARQSFPSYFKNK